MPKIVGTRERVHQPFYDSLIRVDGSKDLRTQNDGQFGAVQSRSQLFLKTGADLATSNLATGGFFPSDQTFVTLAVRVWTYFRFNAEAPFVSAPGEQSPLTVVPGTWRDRVMRVHKLYHQAENQLFWQLQAGDKPQLTTYTAYTPFAGGLDGFFGGVGAPASAGGGGAANPYLLTAANFLVLAASTVTNTGGTVVEGDLGLYAGTSVVGFPPGTVTGTQHVTDGAAAQAQLDLTAAMVALNALGPGTGIAAQLNGQNLIGAPGVNVYSPLIGNFDLAVGGTVTLTGGPTDVFVFLSPATVILNNGSTVALVGGVLPANVYWVAGSSVTVGTTVAAKGNFLALASVTLNTGANLIGRALASTGAVTLDTNNLSLDAAAGGGGAGGDGSPSGDGTGLYRANNGVPTSSALMRLARPVLIPPRQGFQVICQASAIGNTVGASIVEQLNGLVPDNTANAFITGATPPGIGAGTGLSVPGKDNIEKDIKYLIDGIHSRDVL